MTLTSPAMTDHVPDIHPTAAPPAPAAGTAMPVAAVTATDTPAALSAPAAGEAGNAFSANADAAPVDVVSGNDSNADADRPAGNGKRRGGRNRRKPGSADAAQAQQQPTQPPQAEGAKAPRVPRTIPPALDKLAALYPQLFGAVFRPLKRGVFQDLMAAHPEDFEREALKVALGIHTRSTRYLQSVAAGQQRHDLQGQAVEAMAPEHIHQALVEVHRRRSGRNNTNNSNSEELLTKLRARILANIEASGLSREDYAERVRTRDEASNALLDEALAEMAAKTAREEALVRAFEASGKTVEAFADMYGMDPRSVVRSLGSARARAEAADAAAAIAAQQNQEEGQASAGEAEARQQSVPAAPAQSRPAPNVAANKADAKVAPAVPAVPVHVSRRLWCLRSRMTMTPPAPRRGRWA